MEVMSGSEEIPPSAIRSCRIEVPPSGVLNMNGSPYLIVGYLQRDELMWEILD